MTYQIIQNDVIDWAKNYKGEPFHALLADPPYHLTSIHKRFSKAGSAPAKHGKDGAFSRASRGFMGQQWDGEGSNGKGIAFNPETWAALTEHLYPGAFIMAFASTRGFHRMMVAMEDAGLIIHPTIFFLWNFLSGFPKATRIPDERFSRHRYGGQAMKPAVEPIVVAQKPYTGRPVDCIVKTGAGALNIDGGRIGTRTDAPQVMGAKQTSNVYGEINTEGGKLYTEGRWPANLVLSEEGARLLDEQSGEGVSRASYRGLQADIRGDNYNRSDGKKLEDSDSFRGYDDSGGASRMFFQSTWHYEVLEQLANADPLRYEPKVSTAEREAGLDELPERLRHRVNAGGLENEPRFAPALLKNHHPCLKPISLIKYLATLLLPPDTYAPRRICIPFAGSGSEMAGAILAGWDEVVGIEASPEYIPIAEARLRWWSQWPGWGQTDTEKILASLNTGQDQRQLSLFEAAQ